MLFTKLSETTLKILGKAISYDFLATSEKLPTHSFSFHNRSWFSAYVVLSVGLPDHFLKVAPLFAPDWFADTFIVLFFSCYILTQSGIYSPSFLFLQEVLTFPLKFYERISTKYRLPENLNKLSSLPHEFS